MPSPPQDKAAEPSQERRDTPKPRRRRDESPGEHGREPAPGGGGAGEPAAAGGEEEDGQGRVAVQHRVLGATAVAGEGEGGPERKRGGRAVEEGDPDGGALPAARLLRGHLLRRRGPTPRAPAAAQVAPAQPDPAGLPQDRRRRWKVLAAIGERSMARWHLAARSRQARSAFFCSG